MVFLRREHRGPVLGLGRYPRAGRCLYGRHGYPRHHPPSLRTDDRLAFETAKARNGAPADQKKRVTCVVKNNVLYGCKLFVEIFEEVGLTIRGSSASWRSSTP